MPNDRKVTIYDIARRLLISPAMVSRGLQDHSSVSKKTKKKIFEEAAQMGCGMNHFARNLRQQKTKTIGWIVHELKSSFITSVLAGIEKVTAEGGYDLIIAHSSESYICEAANAQNLFHKRVDGIIALLSFDTKDLNHYKPFINKDIPVIFLDRVEQDGNSTVVIIDNAKCGYMATQHLLAQGCKRISHITSSLQRNVYSQRYKGYLDALADHQTPVDDSLLLVSDLSEEASITAAMQVLKMKPLPDGIFATNTIVLRSELIVRDSSLKKTK